MLEIENHIMHLIKIGNLNSKNATKVTACVFKIKSLQSLLFLIKWTSKYHSKTNHLLEFQKKCVMQLNERLIQNKFIPSLE